MFYETSARTGLGLEEAINSICMQMIEKYPSNNNQVKGTRISKASHFSRGLKDGAGLTVTSSFVQTS